MRRTHKQHLVPNQWKLDSMNTVATTSSVLVLDPDHRDREVLVDSVGVTTLDLVQGLGRDRGMRGAVLRNIDLLEHIVASHNNIEDEGSENNDEEMEDYYENHKAWPAQHRN